MLLTNTPESLEHLFLFPAALSFARKDVLLVKGKILLPAGTLMVMLNRRCYHDELSVGSRLRLLPLDSCMALVFRVGDPEISAVAQGTR